MAIHSACILLKHYLSFMLRARQGVGIHRRKVYLLLVESESSSRAAAVPSSRLAKKDSCVEQDATIVIRKSADKTRCWVGLFRREAARLQPKMEHPLQ